MDPSVETAFESFLAHLSDGVILLDVHGAVIYINPRANELLNLFESVHHLYDLHKRLVLETQISWERWEGLLASAGQLSFSFSGHDITVSSKRFVWQGQSFVQFILTGYTRPDGDVSQLSREELLGVVSRLENRRGELARDARNVNHLELLAEAGTVIATSLSEEGILAHFGRYLLDLVDHSMGLAIYRWQDGDDSCQYLADFSRDVRESDRFNVGTYSLTDFPLLQQIRNEPSILVGEGASSIPGPPVWSSLEARSSILLIPLLRGSEPYAAVALGVHLETGYDEILDEKGFKIITTLFNQAGGALDRVNLIVDLQERQQSLRKLTDELDQRVMERTETLNRERDRVQWLLRINHELSSTLDEDRVLMRGLELINEVVMATDGLVLLMDEASGGFILRAGFGEHHEQIIDVAQDVELNRMSAWIVEYRRAMIVDDVTQDIRWLAFSDRELFKSILGIPLIFSGEVIGVMLLFHEMPQAFSESHVHLVEAAAVHVSNAIYNAHLFVLIRNQAERLGHMLRTEQVNTAKIQAILESIADGVLVVDEEGDVVLGNGAFLSMFDLPKDQVLGRKLLDLSGLYSQADDHWLRAIEDWSRNPGRKSGEESVEETLNLTDLNKIIRYHLAPVFSGGKFYGTVTTFRDITQDMEVDRMKNDFVSTVSHELRTPLTVIKGYLDLLLMGAMGEVPDYLKTQLGVIKHNTNRLKDLVDDLLDISRIETGRIQLNREMVSMNGLIHQVAHQHLNRRIEQETRDLSVTLNIQKGMPEIWVDPRRLQQIITNLVDNAVNYTPDGGAITITAEIQGDQMWIGVQDTGIGLSAEQQERVFERFYRGDHEVVQLVAGTGLGLPIVASLIEMHGGVLSVESEVDQGSLFSFTIPQNRNKIE